MAAIFRTYIRNPYVEENIFRNVRPLCPTGLQLQQTLDNLYSWQHPDGFICLKSPRMMGQTASK